MTSTGTAIALLVALVSTGAAITAEFATASEPKTLAQWKKCGDDAIAQALRECKRMGYAEGFCFGNFGERLAIMDACGLMPSSNKLSAEEHTLLAEWCHKSRFDGIPQLALNHFIPYGEDSSQWNLAVEECNKIYAAGVEKRAQEKRKLEANKKAERAKPLSIERVYQSTPNYAAVVVRTNRTREIKCALVNGDGDYIRVESAIVTPPVDELSIRSDGTPWVSASCWSK